MVDCTANTTLLLKEVVGGASSAKILLPPPTSQLTWALLKDLTGKLNLTKKHRQQERDIADFVGRMIAGVSDAN